jgi:hypothetical protein
MLQPSDEPYIAQVVSPFEFKLINGSVIVMTPGHLVREEQDQTGTTRQVAYVFPLSQTEIERRVAELKTIEHRSAIATHFTDYLVLLDNVLVQGMRRSDVGTTPNDQELLPWLEWREKIQAQFDAAKSAVDVVIPPYPVFPSWYCQSEGLRELAKKLGHSGYMTAKT